MMAQESITMLEVCTELCPSNYSGCEKCPYFAENMVKSGERAVQRFKRLHRKGKKVNNYLGMGIATAGIWLGAGIAAMLATQKLASLQ